jgi:hypothetical protein
MMNSVILDVAIGMAFLYLLLSLIASVVQEVLAAFMQLRPANLQRGLRSLLSGNSIGSGPDLVDSIYTHGLVRGLYRDPDRDMNPDSKKRNEENKDQSKAAKVWGVVNNLDWLRRLMRRLIGIHPEKDIAGVSNQMLLPAYIPSRTFAMAMIDLLNQKQSIGNKAMDEIHEFLTWHHSQFRDNMATQAMLTLATDAQGDLKKFQENLENWYNAAMDRASGWYKRYTQTILLVLGLLMAMAFNVDSVRVTKVLWFDRDARQGMVDAANQYMKDHPGPPTKQDGAPAAATDTTPAAPTNGQVPFDAKDLKKRLQDTTEQFDAVTSSALLPVGWKGSYKDNLNYLWHNKEAGSWRLLQLFPGWLITALAISLGAPFWFDLLNKFMVVRSTVKPQEKSQSETSKD